MHGREWLPTFITLALLLLMEAPIGFHRGKPLDPILDTPVAPSAHPAWTPYHVRGTSRRSRTLRMTGPRLKSPNSRY